MTLIRLVMVSLCLSAPISQSYASNIDKLDKAPVLPTTTMPLLIKKDISHKNTSFIEQALNKQKQSLNEPNLNNDDIKIITTIRSQNFFAAQHQSFSRFIQNFFSPHES
ncbi:hypothetical protein GCM10027155_15060 [Acinetobacter apis]|uniref:DUF4179 domain-containing protein n=1 Tax=Acinetobacter apis TaxID=1229165 RepID=A0A217EGX4_9GAMM|nr:DUF4179 domain-containing protein [Acinetobacter apis]SNQ29751.1 hypothetical protein SAMN05444584_1720 [Acinetobacter apis]